MSKISLPPLAAPRVPKARLHKPSGQGVVTLNGHDVYLGPYGSPKAKAAYDRFIAEWLAGGRRLPSAGRTINEVMVPYARHIDVYYRKADGTPTGEAGNIKRALSTLKRLYGDTPAEDFGPLALKACREQFIEGGLARTEVNRRTGYIRAFFKWAVAEELVPPSVHHGLVAVAGLKRGRSAARETDPVKPVPDAFVDAIAPHVSRQVWAMVEMQRLTGMRPGEVCIMRTRDIEMGGRVWVYTPATHKTEHHGRSRRIYIGPAAQEVLGPWLRRELGAFLFSPAEAESERKAARRAARKTKVQPSQCDRSKPDARRKPRDRFDVPSYRNIIFRACHAAGVPVWGPNRLRHNAGTRFRKEYGLDVARVLLGHASPIVTEIYAEVDEAKALEVMAKIG